MSAGNKHPALKFSFCHAPTSPKANLDLGPICPLYRGECSCCAPPLEEQDNFSCFLLKSHSPICVACSAVSVLTLKLFACENIAAHISHLHSFRLYQGIHFTVQLKVTLACSSLRKNVPLTFRYTASCCRKSDLQ